MNCQAKEAKEQFAASWLQEIDIPAKSQMIIQKKLEKYSERAGYAAFMMRIAMIEPNISMYCKQYGNPEGPIIGIIITESQGNPLIADYLYGQYVGYAQMGFQRLPKYLRDDPRIKYYQNLYNHASTSAEKKRIVKKWKHIDPRFNCDWALEAINRSHKENFERTGDQTLANCDNHGGQNNCLRRAGLYREDHEGVPFNKNLILDWRQKQLIAELKSYIEKHKLNYFKFYEDKVEGRGVNYWARKSDSHLTYGFAPVVWSELFARFQKNPSSVPLLAGEVEFEIVQQVEHTLWWTGQPKYKSVKDLMKAYKKGYLIEKPKNLEDFGLKIDEGIGGRDRDNQWVYQTASPAIWGMLIELGSRCQQLNGEERTVYRIDSLVRCIAYPLGQGAWNTSHNYGGAVDIDLDSSGLNEKQLKNLQIALYLMCREGKLGYYIEGNGKGNGSAISIFHQHPYDFTKAGQVHVIVNPAMGVHFKQVYAQKAIEKFEVRKIFASIGAIGKKEISGKMVGKYIGQQMSALVGNTIQSGLEFGKCVLCWIAIFAAVAIVIAGIIVFGIMLWNKREQIWLNTKTAAKVTFWLIVGLFEMIIINPIKAKARARA